MITKKNIPLILGFSIPVLMILFVAVSIYVPGLFLHPKYNFLYSTGGDYYGREVYSVVNDRLIQNPQSTTYPYEKPYPIPQLYIYNVTTNENTQVSFQDAKNFNLDSSDESQDGYKLEEGNSSDGFFPFFFYRRNNDEYLVGHNTSKKLNIKNAGTSYYNTIHFLGWVIQ